MKNLVFVLTLFSLMQSGLNAQPAPDKAFLKKVNLVHTKVPSVFIFKYEVSNVGYREMMAYAKQKDTALYRFLLPDTAVWLTPLSNQEALFEHYFRHPAFSSYPVVGVSYEQAKTYCQLLTEFFNSQLLPENKWLKKVLIRLPTEKEWEEAARGKAPKAIYPWNHDGIRDPKKNTLMANILHNPSGRTNRFGHLNDGLDYLAPSESYPPNSIGLYNMSGNAAEMVEEKGISKGGCWHFGSLNARIDSVLTYSKPESWLGFRYVMEVEEYQHEVNENPLNTIDIKSLEKQLVFMNDTTKKYLDREEQPCVRYALFGSGKNQFKCQPFYISKYETSNDLYRCFLSDVAKTNREMATFHAPIDSLWARETTLKIYQKYSNQSFFKQHPVVNIPKRSAEAFCAWLTEKYNVDPHRKFNKVVFSLPTEEEWLLSANDQHGHTINYIDVMTIAPSDGKSFRYNYCPYDERYSTRVVSNQGVESTGFIFPENDSTQTLGMDGYVYTAPISAYSSKGNNLCNMLGNVSEMLSNQVYTKGGSWASLEENLQMASGECGEGPSPRIGFRFVMHVLE